MSRALGYRTILFVQESFKDSELIFQDMQGIKAGNLRGFEKIKGYCKQVASDGWEYAVSTWSTLPGFHLGYTDHGLVG